MSFLSGRASSLYSMAVSAPHGVSGEQRGHSCVLCSILLVLQASALSVGSFLANHIFFSPDRSQYMCMLSAFGACDLNLALYAHVTKLCSLAVLCTCDQA